MPSRILIIVPSFEIGGTIISLHSILSVIDPTRVSVELFARKREGPYLSRFKNCTILGENYWLTETFTRDTHLNKFKIILIKSLKLVCRKLHIDIKSLFIKRGCKQLRTKAYDAVVSFQENISKDVSQYPAKRRIAWIHSDYSRFLTILGVKEETSVYERFDKVVCVSDYAKSVFDSIYPGFAFKSLSIHNVIDVESISAKASETEGLDTLFDTSQFTIVSAGRLDPVKQFEKIPAIASQIKGISPRPFKWFIIGGSRGFNEVEEKLQSSIEYYRLQDVVIRLSEKRNIYPYIAKSDLYVCTSLSESFPLVVNEAKALCVPIVSTDFPSVKESISEGVDGYVVPIDKMAQKIVALMDNNLKIQAPRINNNEVLQKIYQLFEL